MKLNLKSAFADYAASTKTAFASDRLLTVGASEIGRCSRRAAMRRKGTPKNPGSRSESGFTVRGNVMEDHYTAPLMAHAVEAAGGELLWAGQDNQMQFLAGNSPNSATPDGLVVGVPRDWLQEYGCPDFEADCFLVEFKSYDPRKNTKGFPEDEHLDQLNQQLALVRAEGEYSPMWALIVYVNASDYEDMRAFAVRFQETTWHSQIQRAKAIMAVTDPNQLPPEGKMAGGKECRMCEFSEACLGFVPWVPTGTRDMAPEAVQKTKTLVETIAEAEHQAAEWKARVDRAEGELKALLAQARTKYVRTEGMEVSWNTVEGSERVNSAKMKARLAELGEDLSKYVSAVKPSERLTVKLVDGAE